MANKKIIAKRDFEFECNEDHVVIEKGDDIVEKGVPEKYYPNLKTEQVI
ncbi:MAG: hypothetical protein JKY93_01125 [Gammaproteobacteria bacterium]|nr:hypothetical protein [Gammaproteobacteria bacterium]